MSALYSIEPRHGREPDLDREWVLTNPLGSFAGSTIVGCNTRRYHGLLIAATKPPVGRIMTLSRLGELIERPNNQPTLELSVNQFQNRFHPRGDQYLKTFEIDGNVATYTFDAEGNKVRKEVVLFHEQNTVAVRYTIEPADFRPMKFSLLPFLAMRDFHAVRFMATAKFDTKNRKHGATITDRDSNVAVHIGCDAGDFIAKGDWWFGHFYGIEHERGQEFTEDLYSPGRFTIEITKPTTLTIWASTERDADEITSVNFDEEVSRCASANTPPPRDTQTITRLTRAADDFIVRRKSPDGAPGWTVIAGYPWFADWGRDTMIALPGLLLATKRFDIAAKVLSVFAQYVNEGMIPNRFDDYTNEPHWNTVDASLWFVHACHEYARTSKDAALFESMLKPACRQIVDGYRRGTRFGIKMDEADGLITQGNKDTQLTWMDAKCGDIAFTPRQGKAVEINALWYNALKLLGEEELAGRVKQSFGEAYWISPFRGLADVIDNGVRDTSIRPNQIFAVSLPHSPLTREQQSAVVEVVRRELLTPFGLRTLDAANPNFSPLFKGDQFTRDKAYHNGTIWPWLIGAFLEAYLKVNDRSDFAIAQARLWLQPLIDHLETSGCVGSISEVFEAKPPHRPVGCYAQAWSVSEALRLAIELEM